MQDKFTAHLRSLTTQTYKAGLITEKPRTNCSLNYPFKSKAKVVTDQV